jgi:hypothetical protein
MEFVRQVVNSNSLTSVLNLPPSFRDVDVEVIVLPVDNKTLAVGTSFFKSNPSLIPEEEDVWEKVPVEENERRTSHEMRNLQGGNG